MPVQEPGRKPARPLPYQPNASLAGFSTAGGRATANLTLANNGRHVRRACHFSVYDNTLTTSPGIAGYPAAFPGQYTVAPSRRRGEKVAAAGPVSADGGYDLTVIGPNRFLRRFTGNVTTAGAAATVTADYYPQGRGERPVLTLTLGNAGPTEVTFTVTPNSYSAEPASMEANVSPRGTFVGPGRPGPTATLGTVILRRGTVPFRRETRPS